MEQKEKLSKKIKEGVSVQEIEDFAKKYTTELFIVLALIIAFFSSVFHFFTGPGWSLFFGSLGAIVSLLIPENTKKLGKKVSDLVHKQDRTTQIIVGVVRVAIAIFLPFIVFGAIGLHAGIGFHFFTSDPQ